MKNYPTNAVDVHMFLTRRAALGLEMKGLRHSRGSVYALCKREYGLKGNREKVHAAMTTVRNEILGETE
jgi:hypothetical protein